MTSPQRPSTSTLAAEGPLLGEPPYTRQLDGKLRELRFHLDGEAVRVTYWIATGRRVILLTVFRKTRMREWREVDRPRRAWQLCGRGTHSGRGEWEVIAMTERTDWNDLRGRRMAEPGAADAYEAARLAYELGRTVREMREAHGWTQTKLAEASGMTQSAVARFEAGGTVPTIPVLERLARALDAELVVRLDRPRPAPCSG
jgi:ribosome-binding protein aMBF1 (putative translation factor)